MGQGESKGSSFSRTPESDPEEEYDSGSEASSFARNKNDGQHNRNAISPPLAPDDSFPLGEEQHHQETTSASRVASTPGRGAGTSTS
ncbi:unnamed protein product, partial [Amoebophrya sp. A120]|eukprot:GSA120T00005962001.1